ncbi:MAG: hypothetical protein GXO88_06080 [Chlorobi bacterium]|nr:hypothetical protein [Chlorobiota bacterium]
MKKHIYRIPGFLMFLFLITSCAAGSEKFTEETAGFLMGAWHGFISLFSFVASLFVDGIEVYEKNNNGNWYNFGFIIGIMIFYGGGGKGACGRRK